MNGIAIRVRSRVGNSAKTLEILRGLIVQVLAIRADRKFAPRLAIGKLAETRVSSGVCPMYGAFWMSLSRTSRRIGSLLMLT